ncbi:hypothetical protein E4T56_gene20120, partial [Termitomyces sp. T112]
LDAAQREKGALQWEQDTSVQVATEWALEVQEGQQVALEGGLLQVELEAVGQREDWLAILHFVANKLSLVRLGVGAPSSPGWCLRSTGIDPRWVDINVHVLLSGASAGDGKNGEVAGGALAVQRGGPRVVVGGGDGHRGGLARVGRGSNGGAGLNRDQFGD